MTDPAQIDRLPERCVTMGDTTAALRRVMGCPGGVP